MAIVYATKTGNWSDTTVWNTGALPTSADDVYSNTFTVTINQNVTVKSISNDSASGVTAGGGFTVTATPITITANLIQQLASSTTLLTVNQGAIGLLNVIGNVTANRGTAISLTSYNVLNITGNVYGGTTTSSSVYGVAVNYSSGNITINGSIYGGTGSGSTNVGILINNNYLFTTVIVNGSIFAGMSTNSYGIMLSGVNSNTTINVTGDVVGGNGSGAAGISIGANSLSVAINVTGNVYTTASSSSSSSAISNISTGHTGSITITGTITGGNSAAVYMNSAGSGGMNIFHTGSCVAGTSGTAIATYSMYTYTTGPLICNAETGANVVYAGYIPVTGRVMIYPIAFGAFYFRMYSAATSGSPASRQAKDLYFIDAFNSSYPATTNVRSGTAYGVGNAYTGTCAVPPAGSVALGVPVDNTTGTAYISASDIQTLTTNALTAASAVTLNQNAASLTTPGSIGERLKTVSTVATTGQQLSDALSG